MRIELAPLCVRVVTIVTGGVESNFYNNADQRCHLPEGSLYAPLEVNIEKFDFVASVKWTQAPDYARQVASDLLRPKPKMVLWRASMSTFAWIIDSFGWTGMLVSLFFSLSRYASVSMWRCSCVSSTAAWAIADCISRTLGWPNTFASTS